MGYTDLASIQVPTSGVPAAVAWGQGVRDNDEALVRAPKTKVARTTNFGPVVATTVTPLPFDTIRHQQAGGVIWAAANPTRFTAPKAGVYHYDALVTHPAGAAAAYGIVFIRLNGVTLLAEAANNTYPIGETCNLSGDVSLVAGDYLEVCVYNSAAATYVPGNGTPAAAMHWVGLL